MQVVGDLSITNISKYEALVRGAKFRDYESTGHVLVAPQGDIGGYSQDNSVPVNGTSQLRFVLWIQPPVRDKDQSFEADVAIIDKFGNEHWKSLNFKYL